MFQRIPLLLLLLISTSSSAASAQDATQATPQPTTLKAGTDVTLRLMARFSPKHAKLGDQVAFRTVWHLEVGGTIVWPAGYSVNGTVTSLKPIVEVTLDPQTLPVGQVKFAGHPFKVIGFGKDHPPPRTTRSPEANIYKAADIAAIPLLPLLLTVFAVEETAHFIKHPFGGSNQDRPRFTVTVVKVAEDMPVTQTQVNH
jgi:hypothetical protein